MSIAFGPIRQCQSCRSEPLTPVVFLGHLPLADAIAKGNKVDKDADDFFKANKDELKPTMWIFKPRETGGKGGLGVGAKPGVYTPDGIEVFILDEVFAKLPTPPFTPEEKEAVAGNVYAHVWQQAMNG